MENVYWDWASTRIERETDITRQRKDTVLFLLYVQERVRSAFYALVWDVLYNITVT